MTTQPISKKKKKDNEISEYLDQALPYDYRKCSFEVRL